MWIGCCRSGFAWPTQYGNTTVSNAMKRILERLSMRNSIWRAVVEVAFIIFLFYSNLLMGEMERTSNGRDKGLLWDLQDMFTLRNLIVAIVAAFIGYAVVERLRDSRRYTRRKE
jgi:hypothetical protein